MKVIILWLLVALSLALIVLVTLQPRQTQIFSSDATSNIGKPSFWASQRVIKWLTLLVSGSLFVCVFLLMMLNY